MSSSATSLLILLLILGSLFIFVAMTTIGSHDKETSTPIIPSSGEEELRTNKKLGNKAFSVSNPKEKRESKNTADGGVFDGVDFLPSSAFSSSSSFASSCGELFIAAKGSSVSCYFYACGGDKLTITTCTTQDGSCPSYDGSSYDASVDTYLYLYNENGNLLAENDDCTYGYVLCSHIVYTVPSTSGSCATYDIKQSCYAGQCSGRTYVYGSSAPTPIPTSAPIVSPPTKRPVTSSPTGLPSMQPTQPTSQPTEQPSRQPSKQPSSQPSVQPSVSPSRKPSSKPSRQPSSQPSRQPSKQPSGQPTASPSAQPSRQPIGQPSAQPSRQPSTQPSVQPSDQPSRQPSMQPSIQPSTQPSNRPSRQPSMQPSIQPSTQPSNRPSRQPSTQPTTQPSKQPSVQPTEQPSTQPSIQPTTQPSIQPSMQPSTQPTAQPSEQPSAQPTEQPSLQPSNQPSVQPSAMPSMQPSSQPSAIPSGQPSEQPSTQPSMQPTSQPSEQPSAVPSTQPSEQPSEQPSKQPTSLPTNQPSLIPTCQPTGWPSMQPSMVPSVQPSSGPTQQPSRQPSHQPSTTPSGQPSSSPTGQPSVIPTLQPTGKPSCLPTNQPSSRPSTQPSTNPTSDPTTQPSMAPSCNPSSHPSGSPTCLPSQTPTSLPTTIPSSQPSSSAPSSRPTLYTLCASIEFSVECTFDCSRALEDISCDAISGTFDSGNCAAGDKCIVTRRRQRRLQEQEEGGGAVAESTTTLSSSAKLDVMVDSKSERSRGENIHVAAETFMYLVQFSIFGTPSDLGLDSNAELMKKINKTFTDGTFAQNLYSYASSSHTLNESSILTSISSLRGASIVGSSYDPNATRKPTKAPTAKPTRTPTAAPTNKASVGLSPMFALIALLVLSVPVGIFYVHRRRQQEKEKPLENIYALEILENEGKEEGDDSSPDGLAPQKKLDYLGIPIPLSGNPDRHELSVVDLDGAVRITIRDDGEDDHSVRHKQETFYSVTSMLEEDPHLFEQQSMGREQGEDNRFHSVHDGTVFSSNRSASRSGRHGGGEGRSTVRAENSTENEDSDRATDARSSVFGMNYDYEDDDTSTMLTGNDNDAAVSSVVSSLNAAAAGDPRRKKPRGSGGKVGGFRGSRGGGILMDDTPARIDEVDSVSSKSSSSSQSYVGTDVWRSESMHYMTTRSQKSKEMEAGVGNNDRKDYDYAGKSRGSK